MKKYYIENKVLIIYLCTYMYAYVGVLRPVVAVHYRGGDRGGIKPSEEHASVDAIHTTRVPTYRM